MLPHKGMVYNFVHHTSVEGKRWMMITEFLLIQQHSWVNNIKYV